MSAKISALTDPGPPDTGFYVTYIDATPDNFKCTIAELLTAPAGGAKQLKTVTGEGVTVDDATHTVSISVTGATFQIINGGILPLMKVDTAGNITLSADSTHSMILGGFTGGMTFGSGIVQILKPIGGVIQMDFVATNILDWIGAPTDTWTAINRIAARVAMGGAGPIA